jgi:hypothetical protein
VLRENPFNRDGRRAITRNPAVNHLLYRQEPMRDIQVGGRTYDVDRDEQGLAAGDAVDHTETAPGQTRVDSQHPHAIP